MIKIGEKTFFLTDRNGDEMPFSVQDLQSELIYCFLSVGMSDSSCFAEDVALAVEYSLQESENFGGCVSVDELGRMVVEILENSGFYLVADCFKQRNGRELEVLFSTSAESLQTLSAKHGILLYGVDSKLVINRAAGAFKAMNVEIAPLPLIIEMIRYYNGCLRTGDEKTLRKKQPVKGDYLVKVQDVVQKIPEKVKELFENGVLKVNDVTVYHPSIRITLNIKEYAAYKQLTPLITEMFWQPCGAELGQSIDALSEVLSAEYAEKGGRKELPIYLTVCGMNDFAVEFFGTMQEKSRKVSEFLIENLSSNMFYPIYKVRF